MNHRTEFEEFKRLNFFNGFFTTARDWNAGQDYHLNKRRLHNRGLHTPGIIRGEQDELRVISIKGLAVQVLSGAALDGDGHEIYLIKPRDLIISPPKEEAQWLYVAIQYGAEQPSDWVENEQDSSYSGFTRISETAELKVLTSLPDNLTWLELARIYVQPDAKAITNPDDAALPAANAIDRRYVPWAGAAGAVNPADSLPPDLAEQLILQLADTRAAFAELDARFPCPSAGDVRHTALTLEVTVRLGSLPLPKLGSLFALFVATEQDVAQEIGAAYPTVTVLIEYARYVDAVKGLWQVLKAGNEVAALLNEHHAVISTARELAQAIFRTPIAEAGPNQTLPTTGVEQSVALDATPSRAFDGRTLTTYTWSEVKLMTISTLIVTNQPKTQVTLPIGTHVLELVVTDSAGLTSEPDRVTITVVSQAVPPLITGISPNSGLPGETINATITGSGLSGATAVTFEHTGVTATIQHGGTAEELPIRIMISSVDRSIVGKWHVTVRTPAGSTTSSTPLFEVKTVVQPPEITGITPVSGLQNTTIADAAISGNNLLGATAVSSDGTGVTITPQTGGTATSLPIQIEIAQSAPVGKRRLTVVTPSGSGSSDPIFEVKAPVLPPKITGIAPNRAAPDTELTAAITGENLSGVRAVEFLIGNNVDPTIVAAIKSADNPASLSVNLAITTITLGRLKVPVLGPRPFRVTPASGSTVGSGSTVLTVIQTSAPLVASITPDSGNVGAVIAEVILTGANFNKVTGVAFYHFVRGGVALDDKMNVTNFSKVRQQITFALQLSEEPGPRYLVLLEETLGNITGATAFTFGFTVGTRIPTSPTRSVEEVVGIGAVMTQRLTDAGVKDLVALAATDSKRISTVLGISEQRAVGFIAEAKRLLRG